MVSDSNMKRYFALGIIVVFAVVILFMLKKFFKPILAAFVMTFLVYPIYIYLFNKTKKDILSASIVLFLLFLVILIPVSAKAGVFVNQVNNFDPAKLDSVKYEKSIYDLTGRNISISGSITTIGTALKQEVKDTFPRFLTLTSNFLLATFVMFFVMFYLLIEKNRIIKFVRNILPFSKKNSTKLIDESGKVTKAILIGQVLTAIIQGLLGMLSFLVVGINGAFFWGIIMIILSVIPVIGAFLIRLPEGLFLLREGQVWQGVFVLVWGALVVSQVDNIVRPKLVNKFANIHPLETFLGVIIGLTTFGIVGLILGPLIVSLFRTLIRVYVSEYVD